LSRSSAEQSSKQADKYGAIQSRNRAGTGGDAKGQSQGKRDHSSHDSAKNISSKIIEMEPMN
jgi:hypothetical protein